MPTTDEVLATIANVDDREAMRDWIKDHPEALVQGTKDWHVTQSAHTLAHFRGMEFGSPEYRALLDEHVPGAPSPRKDANTVRLSKDEVDVARICGISQVDYARGVLRLREEKQTGLHGGY
jgi:hypothetical protein